MRGLPRRVLGDTDCAELMQSASPRRASETGWPVLPHSERLKLSQRGAQPHHGAKLTGMSGYHQVHYAARKRKRDACQRCRGTTRLQMALNPAAPADNLRVDPASGLRYSINPYDYLTLCSKCHHRMDGRLRTACERFRRARMNAPLCNVCDEPMMVGQHGTHLTCAPTSKVTPRRQGTVGKRTAEVSSVSSATS